MLVALTALSAPVVLTLLSLLLTVAHGGRESRRQIMVSIDQHLNAMLHGWADETISARVWRNRNKSKWWHGARVVIDWVFEHLFDDPAHCARSYAAERARMHMPPELRDRSAA